MTLVGHFHSTETELLPQYVRVDHKFIEIYINVCLKYKDSAGHYSVEGKLNKVCDTLVQWFIHLPHKETIVEGDPDSFGVVSGRTLNTKICQIKCAAPPAVATPYE